MKPPISPWSRTVSQIHGSIQQKSTERSATMSEEMPEQQETAIPAPRRKRNNSLIPPELMNDKSEGGRERAALATVFGVREYTESKIFWERQSEQQQQQDIAAYIDSALDGVGSDKNNITTLSSPSAATKDENNIKSADFMLPEIPVVSQFGELLIDDKNIQRQPAPSSSIHTFTSSAHEYAPSLSSEQRATYDIEPPLVFIGYPPSIFDLLVSDDDERVIVWGPDPQALSASMATTTVAGKQQPPNNNIKGFASNATMASSSSSSATPDKSRSKSRIMSRLSGRLPDGLVALKPPFKRSRASLVLSSSSQTSKKDNNDLVQDRSVSLKDVPKVIEAATVEKLVEKLTNTLDYTFMTDFFLTYRTFISPTQLCKLLILRFRWGLENDEDARRVVRIRTFVVIRHWLLNYFVHDFIPCRELRVVLTSFLNSLPYHPLVKQSPRDQRIVKGLKRVVRRLKKVYYVSSSASDRVKVIPPPPPTEEQERVEEMVRAKLAQSTIRRKTALVSSVNVSDKHHGNMAVEDACQAPVVVIGSLRNNTKARRRRPPPLPSYSGNSSTTSPPNVTRRKMSSTASVASRFGKKHRQDTEAVKASYFQRLEQQKRAMDQTSAKESENNDDSRRSSVMSDESLESALSPGTTDVEMSDDTSTEEADDDDDLVSPSSLDSPPGYDEQMTRKLEYERQRREEEEERKRAEFFAGAAATSELDNNSGSRQRPVSIISSSSNSNSLAVSSVHPAEKRGQLVSRIAEQLRADQASSQFSEHKSTDYQSFTTDKQPKQQRDGSGPVYLGQLAGPTATTAMSVSEKAVPTQEVETGGSSSYERKNSSSIRIRRRRRQKRQSLASSSTTTATATTTDRLFVEEQQEVPPLPEIVKPQATKSLQASMFSSSKHNSSGGDGYRSFLLEYRSDRLARQFCLIEAEVLLNIDWEEMVHCRWTKMSTEKNNVHFAREEEEFSESLLTDEEEDNINYTRRNRQLQLARREGGGIEQVIKRFNAVCQWVASEIVRTPSLEERVKVVEKLIRLAQKCKLYCNFATLVQILLGLQSPAVSRLRKTWARVGSTELRVLDQLSAFTSPMKNWKHIRDSMTEVAEEYGMSPAEVQIEMPGTTSNKNKTKMIKIPFGGCIPFLGIYLSDLVFNSEQPPYLQPNHEHHKIYHANTRSKADMISPVLKQPLVNFRKHRITATVIKRVLIFQNLARRYSFKRDEEVYRLCYDLEATMDAETIRRLSHEIEP